MLISRDIRDNIDLALIEAFIHHRFPTLEFSSSKVSSSTHTIVIDGFHDNDHAARFTAALKNQTGVQL